MKTRFVLLVFVFLLIFVSFSCVISEMSWIAKEGTTDYLRRIVGLPSVAIGNLSPAARNPGLEIFCTSLYDVPGGYCNYFTPGVAFINSTLGGNITVSGQK
jgi:hypothetical protein